MGRIEPPKQELEEWATGLRNTNVPVAAQYANWAYWYLGFDEPDFRVGDVLTNGCICKITEACSLRLKELAGDL